MGRWQEEPADGRFWAMVEKTPTCWLWRGAVNQRGYGAFRAVTAKTVRAHRFSWELSGGEPVPNGLQVLHRCDVRHCVNPQHLFLGDNQDNHRDKVKKGRQARGTNVGSGKLRNDEVTAIRQMVRSGAGHLEAGACFGVSRSQVGAIVRAKNWAWLP